MYRIKYKGERYFIADAEYQNIVERLTFKNYVKQPPGISDSYHKNPTPCLFCDRYREVSFSGSYNCTKCPFADGRVSGCGRLMVIALGKWSNVCFVESHTSFDGLKIRAWFSLFRARLLLKLHSRRI